MRCTRSSPWLTRQAEGDGNANTDLIVGARVEAVFADDGRWYRATIATSNDDGSFEVMWDDPDCGPTVSNCGPTEIKKLDMFVDYQVGDLVEAVYSVDGQRYPGIVAEAPGNGSFMIQWDDRGDDETGVSCCMPDDMALLFQDYKAGDTVEAVFPDDGNWYDCVVDQVNGDGSFEVRWDDVEEGAETSTCTPAIMRQPFIFKDYKVGDPVEAVFTEDGSWYPGTVERNNGDGTFEVRWSDSIGGPAVSACTPRRMQQVIIFRDYEVGDAVMAKSAEDGELYPGVVGAVAGDDGTFLVTWDDASDGPEASPCRPEDMSPAALPDFDARSSYDEGSSDFNWPGFGEEADVVRDVAVPVAIGGGEEWDSLVRRRRSLNPTPCRRRRDRPLLVVEDNDDDVFDGSDPESMLQLLQELDPDIPRDDYFDTVSGTWDLDGLVDDLRVTQERLGVVGAD